MIKTIIFDIGGVLIGYDWTDYLMGLFHDREICERIKEAAFYSGLWDEVDRGVWSEDQILAKMTEKSGGLSDEIHTFWNSFHLGAMWQFDFVKDLILDLKSKGYQVLYLSNWSAHMREEIADKLDFLPLMDGGVFSYEEHLIKPDAAIYQRILEKYSLKAEECVFLDDKIKNVRAAEACGMNTVHVVDHETAHAELYHLLETGEHNIKTDGYFMTKAIELSEAAAEHGNEPFGAVLVKDNEIVYANENQIYTMHDPTFHGEMGLIRRFCSETGITDLSDYTMYSSCEPCFMCSGAMVWTKLGRLVYAASNNQLEAVAGGQGCECSSIVFEHSSRKPTVTKGVLMSPAVQILQRYFSKR